MLKHSGPLTSLRNAGVKRDGKWLVRGVDMHVDQGQIVTLIGPNGSGKSTTAKMAFGLVAKIFPLHAGEQQHQAH